MDMVFEDEIEDAMFANSLQTTLFKIIIKYEICSQTFHKLKIYQTWLVMYLDTY